MNRNNIIAIVVIAVVVGIVAYILGARSSSDDRTAVRSGSAGQGGDFGAYPQRQTDVNEVIAALEKQIAEDPKNPKFHVSLAKVYFGMQRFDVALEHYKVALKLDPKDVDSYNDIGLSLHYLKRSAEGVKYIDEGIKENPYYQRIWLTKGFILASGLNDVKGAKEAWGKAMAIDPNSEIGLAAKSYIAKIDQAKAGK